MSAMTKAEKLMNFVFVLCYFFHFTHIVATLGATTTNLGATLHFIATNLFA